MGNPSRAKGGLIRDFLGQWLSFSLLLWLIELTSWLSCRVRSKTLCLRGIWDKENIVLQSDSEAIGLIKNVPNFLHPAPVLIVDVKAIISQTFWLRMELIKRSH